MIELKQVTKQYGQATVLKNMTLSIDEPGIYCLLGRNGAGKTTLLKSIAGYQNITNGTIQVDGKTITTSTLDTGVSYIENFAKHFNLPVRKLLRIASEVNPNYDYDFASEMMERFELDGKKKFNHLSLGMKTMVSTIICLASNKEVGHSFRRTCPRLRRHYARRVLRYADREFSKTPANHDCIHSHHRRNCKDHSKTDHH